MKFYALMALLGVAIVVLIGCTGCDSNPQETGIDLTTDRLLLFNPGGWRAQEDTYSLETRRGLKQITYLTIEEVESTGMVLCRLLDDTPTTIDSGWVIIEEDSVTVDFGLCGPYSIRITANGQEAEPDFSLTCLDEEALLPKMYFSLGGGEAN